MTTIAYKAGIMACDSRWAYQGMVDTGMTKIRRLASGALIGGSGDNDGRDIEALFQKVKTPAGLPSRTALMSIRCDYLGLLVLPRGRVFKIAATHISEPNWDKDMDGDIGIWEISQPFAAVGSGTEFAMGAMAAGKSAADACRIACRFDINSGLPVHQIKLAK